MRLIQPHETSCKNAVYLGRITTKTPPGPKTIAHEWDIFLDESKGLPTRIIVCYADTFEKVCSDSRLIASLGGSTDPVWTAALNLYKEKFKDPSISPNSKCV